MAAIDIIDAALDDWRNVSIVEQRDIINLLLDIRCEVAQSAEQRAVTP